MVGVGRTEVGVLWKERSIRLLTEGRKRREGGVRVWSFQRRGTWSRLFLSWIKSRLNINMEKDENQRKGGQLTARAKISFSTKPYSKIRGNISWRWVVSLAEEERFRPFLFTRRKKSLRFSILCIICITPFTRSHDKMGQVTIAFDRLGGVWSCGFDKVYKLLK